MGMGVVNSQIALLKDALITILRTPFVDKTFSLSWKDEILKVTTLQT